MSSSHSHSHICSHHQRPTNRIPGNSPSPPSSSSSSTSSSSWGRPVHRHWSSIDPMDTPFTPEMRDRQARGKDPYLPEAAADSSRFADSPRGRTIAVARMRLDGGRAGGGARASRQPKEPFQNTERRDWAETVLDNPELLLMYAQSSGDTLPATRLKFKKIMCGLEDDESDDDASGEDVSRRGGGHQYDGHNDSQQQRYGGASGRGGGGASGGGGGGRGGGR